MKKVRVHLHFYHYSYNKDLEESVCEYVHTYLNVQYRFDSVWPFNFVKGRASEKQGIPVLL